MSEAGIGTNVYIRGVGSQVNQGFEQSVATYVDGIYYGRPRQLRTPFFDLERVEVLRGPQSILFGKNAIAGALSLITQKPSDEFEAELTALYEPQHDERIFTGIVSGPITDRVSGRLSVRKRDMEGYIDNITLDRDEMQSDEWVTRGSLSWEVSDRLSIDFKAEIGEYDTKGRNIVVLGDPAPGGGTPIVNDFQKRTVNDADWSNNEYDSYTLTLNYDVGNSTITAISGWSGYEFEEFLDADSGINTIFVIPSTEKFEQFSQEIRLASPGGERLDYIVGAFYQTSELDFEESFVLSLPSGLNVDLDRDYGSDSDLWATFAQATWNITDTFRATLGLRYTKEDKDGFRRLVTRNLDGSIFPTENFSPLGSDVPPLGVYSHNLTGDRSEEVTTPSLILQWDATETSMWYASISTGYKAGGFDARSTRRDLPNGDPALEFEEEEAISYEIGGKLTLFDNLAELNLAVFRTEYDDLQVSVYDGIIGYDVQNAAEAVSTGFELDGRWLIVEHLTLSGSLGYTKFEFDNYPLGACYKGQAPDSVVDGVGFCDWDGNTNQFTPEWSGVISGDYRYPLSNNFEIVAGLDLIYSDDYFAAPDLDPNLEQEAFWKVNARLGIGSSDGRWDLLLIGQNLTDEEVVTFGNDVPLSGAAQSYFSVVDRPATVAIQGRYRF